MQFIELVVICSALVSQEGKEAEVGKVGKVSITRSTISSTVAQSTLGTIPSLFTRSVPWLYLTCTVRTSWLISDYLADSYGYGR
jgi:hypothetical protein